MKEQTVKRTGKNEIQTSMDILGIIPVITTHFLNIFTKQFRPSYFGSHLMKRRGKRKPSHNIKS